MSDDADGSTVSEHSQAPGPWTWTTEPAADGMHGRTTLTAADGTPILWGTQTSVYDDDLPSPGVGVDYSAAVLIARAPTTQAERDELLEVVKLQTRLIHRLVCEMEPDRPGWSEWKSATELLARVQGILNRVEPE